jgi:acetyl esterase/lipase
MIPLLLLVSFFRTNAQTTDPPFRLPPNVEMQTDIVYAQIGDRALVLDLFLPKEGAGPFPAVIYVHGGGWSGGNKRAFHRQAAHMATHGIAGVCVQYRLSGEARYPAAIHDVKAAVRWMRANARQYKLRSDRIGAAGGSAGGHLVALLGVTGDHPAYEGNVGVTGQSTRVHAVAAFNPAVDIVSFGRQAGGNRDNPVAKFLAKLYSEAPELYRQASPLEQVSAKSPPFLFLHGTGDTTVPHQQSADMHHALEKVGVSSELMSAPGAAHGFFNRPPWFDPTLERMQEFFLKTLRGK